MVLALIGGTSAARMLPSMADAPHQQCDDDEMMMPQEPAPSDHSGHDRQASAACCLDCLGCAIFADLSGGRDALATPAFLSTVIAYDNRTILRTGRTLAPDLGPPRMNA